MTGSLNSENENHKLLRQIWAHFALSECSEETEAEKCAQHMLLVSRPIKALGLGFLCGAFICGYIYVQHVHVPCMCMYIISCMLSATEELNGKKDSFAFWGKGSAQSKEEQEASIQSCG